MHAIRDDDILTRDEVALYDEMTLRKPAASRGPSPAALFFENVIGRCHCALVVLLHVAAVASLAALFARRRHAPIDATVSGAILLIASTVLLRAALFSWLDAGSGTR
jgi:hypothetical protein